MKNMNGKTRAYLVAFVVLASVALALGVYDTFVRPDAGVHFRVP